MTQIKIIKKIDKFFLGDYSNDTLEIKKKTHYMLYIALVIFPILLFYLIKDLKKNLFEITWVFVGDIIFFIILGISLICIKKHKPFLATNLFFGSYLNIFFTFCLGDYFFPDIYVIEEILITTLFLVIAITVFSQLVLEKRHYIVHGIICNSIIIFNYVFILQKNQLTQPEQLELLIYSLILLNISIFISFKIYISYHELVQSIEEKHALTKVIEGFIPICANCKSIRLGTNEDDEWQEIEEYIKEKSHSVEFTHTLCKKCLKKLYPDLKL